MTDRRRGPGQQDRPREEDNPFAPPPEGQPDRPWRPRHPDRQDSDGVGQGGGQDGEPPQQDDQAPRWGSQWSRRQPRRQSGGFGDPPPGPEGQDRNGPGGLGGGRRGDPSDPAQRHARYSVLAGMWGVFAGLLGWEWLALLLGALALYWGISALRGGPRPNDGGTTRSDARRNRLVAQLEGRAPEEPARADRRPDGQAPGLPRSDRPQLPAAIAGTVLAAAALVIVATTYTVQLVYKDYFDCVDDALTRPSAEACERLLPNQLRPFLTDQE